MTVGLAIKKKEGESWKECARRYGAENGLEHEVMDSYESYIRAGNNEANAAWSACVDWDVADLFDSSKGGYV
jgi:hypothetical protein